jgi:hypothetical protein
MGSLKRAALDRTSVSVEAFRSRNGVFIMISWFGLADIVAGQKLPRL